MKKILMVHISKNENFEYNLGNFSFMIAKEIEKLNGIPFPFVFSFDSVVLVTLCHTVPGQPAVGGGFYRWPTSCPGYRVKQISGEENTF